MQEPDASLALGQRRPTLAQREAGVLSRQSTKSWRPRVI